ncbi:uncharacterized protein LOC121984232 [Zingiber officinale]|uniref:uncharacterized protein LOC121984232 n=1 Tax=Zingiber officinale TaxID=94328 RepID=UPI001C4AFD48|nr:uncharacterized protein LOC121984232 [Zingiber officinale]XP_042393004.1 uncharacterized protein LOC121984232 [Zingiber officinale]XP_042393005.1 uncharacterized protein LOC121984232 [Zingiber officinale]
MDDKGNVYVADISNMAIRKITESGVTTIAGGKSNIAGYRDGPSEDAKFSNDFDVIYVGRTCSLLVVDRGNAALRQISLQQEDCQYQYTSVSTSVEVATEVQQESNNVKLIFKRLTDAEMAFSSARKYGWFGPSLLSYHLRYLSSTPDTFADIQQSDNYAALPEHSNLETPGNDSEQLHSCL